jgi:pyruvate dehydrogenase E1 component beta subunit
MPVMTYRDALRAAMADEMARDETVVLLGEDIGLYGGTHLVTDGLLDRFGPSASSTRRSPRAASPARRSAWR